MVGARVEAEGEYGWRQNVDPKTATNKVEAKLKKQW
jgi:hypothetical protein